MMESNQWKFGSFIYNCTIACTYLLINIRFCGEHNGYKNILCIVFFFFQVEPNEHVIDQGDDGDNFYVIDRYM